MALYRTCQLMGWWSAAIQNVIHLTRAVRDLQADGYFVRREDLAQLSPCQTRRLKGFGDYTLSLGAPDPFESDLVVPFRWRTARNLLRLLSWRFRHSKRVSSEAIGSITGRGRSGQMTIEVGS